MAFSVTTLLGDHPLYQFFSFIGVFLLTFLVLFIIDELMIFLFPRKDSLAQRYPGEGIYLMIINQHRQLEMMKEYVDLQFQNKAKKSIILSSSILPTFVATTDVNNVQYILKDAWKNYGKEGDIFKPRLQGLLGDGIFNADGHQWFAHRKTSAHLFKMNKFKGNILDVFNDDLNQLIAVIKTKVSANQIMDIHDLLHRFTLESISRVAFGISLGCITNPEINFAKDFDYCTMCINDSFLNPVWMIERYFTPKGWKYFYALNRINKYANSIIHERRKEIARGEGLEKNDLLTLYLNNESFKDLLGKKNIGGGGGDDEDGINATQEDLDAFMEPTDKNLRDVILNMVIAGRDTTAQALSWSFYRLCIHPETQKKLREEALAIYGKSPNEENKSKTELEVLMANDGIGKVAWNTLQQMKYTEAFCMEVLRLHPSVPKEAKEAKKDDVLPDGTAIRKGDIAAFLPWCMGRDKELWGQDAEEFHPERFLDQPKPSPFKFIAFQAGPRTCLGQNFALLEMKCVLSRLLLLFEFTLAQDPSTVTYGLSLTLPILGGLQVRAKALAK